MRIHSGVSREAGAAALYRAAEALAATTPAPPPLSRKQATLIRPRFRSMIASTKPLAIRIAAAVDHMRSRFWKAAPSLGTVREADPTDEDAGPDEPNEPPMDRADLEALLMVADHLGPDELFEALRGAAGASYRDGVAHIRGELDHSFTGPDPRAIGALNTYELTFATSVSNDEKDALKALLRKAFEDGVSLQQLAHDIAEHFEDGIHRVDTNGVTHAVDVDDWAQMVARTETARAQNAGQLDAYAQAGFAKIIWITAEDEKTCPICRPLEGKAVAIGELFPGVEIVAPPAHPSCRCTIVGLSDLTSDLVRKDATS